MAYHIRDRRLTGSIFKTFRICGKLNCRCAKNKRHWHPMFYLEYTEIVKGKRIKKHIYVKKSEVQVLKEKIKLAKARDAEFKHFLREVNRIRAPLDKDAWATLNQLKTQTPSFSEFSLSLIEQIALMRSLLNLTTAIEDSISSEEARLIELHHDILDKVKFLREHGYEPTI